MQSFGVGVTNLHECPLYFSVSRCALRETPSTYESIFFLKSEGQVEN